MADVVDKVLKEVHRLYGILFMKEEITSLTLKDHNMKELEMKTNLIRQKVYENDDILMKIKGKSKLKMLSA